MAGLEIIVGTYEEFTIGYNVDRLKTDDTKLCLRQSFATHNHTSSVRVVTTHGKFLATGGADDRICIYDLGTRSEVEELLHHDGTVNTLTFSSDGKYLMSGSAEGKMSAINTKTWKVDKVWEKAHTGSVNHISIHPSGTLALSIGADVVLRTWNMLNGRQAYATNLKNKPSYGGFVSIVEWSPDGDNFVLVGNRIVEAISVDTTKTIKSVTCESKPTSIAWFTESELIVGLEDGHILFFNIFEKQEPLMLKIFDSRIKSISCCDDYVAIASSAGDVSLWCMKIDEFNEICSTNIGCRPICLTLINAARYGVETDLKVEEVDEEKLEIVKAARRIHSIGVVTVETDDSPPKVKKNKKKKVVEEDEPEAEAEAEAKEGEKRKHKKKKNKDGSLWEETLDESVSEDKPKKKKKLVVEPEEVAEETPKKKHKKNPELEETPEPTKKKKKKESVAAISEEEEVPKSHKKSKKAPAAYDIADDQVAESPKKDKKKKKGDKLNNTIGMFTNEKNVSTPTFGKSKKQKRASLI